ncbi:MAG: exo-alpha-sialidase [Bacteroidales bacterium]|nr:exo-alpha-sialidase [Bacteroidales bacterium]
MCTGFLQQTIWAVIIAVFLGLTQPVNSQSYGDTVSSVSGKGGSVRLSLAWNSENHGSIQWQISHEPDKWTDIPGATAKNLMFTADTSALFRAKVVSGSCTPFYSQVTFLRVLDISTLSTDSVTDSQAVIQGTMAFEGMDNSEKGILIDTKSLPDASSLYVRSNQEGPVFTVRVSALIPGQKYYARIYVILADGTLVLGNIIHFTTVKIEGLNRINLTDSSAFLWYRIKNAPVVYEHGIFHQIGSIPDTNSAQHTGMQDNMDWRAELEGLYADSVYYALPFVKIFGTYCFANPIRFKTFSDYTNEEVDDMPFAVSKKIEWKPYSTAKLVSQPGIYADYGRIKRLGNSDTLFLVYHGGPANQDWINVYLRKSFDNGNTWQNHEIMADISKYSNYWRFCNPELIELKNGWIILAYTGNGKPETNENCYIHLLTSKDRGKTWSGPQLIQTGRSWEPAIIQLPHGELELFYSSEARWWPAQSGVYIEQEIHAIHSTDNGQTWSFPQTVAYYPGKRDGMAVPLVLQENKGIVFTIETVNIATSPYIVKRDLAGSWILTESGFESSPYRWLAGSFSGHGGAPYMIQLPTGECVLSAHVYRGGDWHQNNYMQVMIGDNDARNFGSITTPWGVLPTNESAVNNSLFMKNSTTIVAVSGRNFRDVSGGIYWLEGSIVSFK